MSDPATQSQRIEFQKKMVACQVWATCLNCEHWGNLTEVTVAEGCEPEKKMRTGCSIAGYQCPPPDVIVHGCPAWLADIPF